MDCPFYFYNDNHYHHKWKHCAFEDSLGKVFQLRSFQVPLCTSGPALSVIHDPDSVPEYWGTHPFFLKKYFEKRPFRGILNERSTISS